MGKEVMKAGMAASLATTFLTGYRILRPMKFHPIAASAFLGFALAHILMSEREAAEGEERSKGRKISPCRIKNTGFVP